MINFHTYASLTGFIVVILILLFVLHKILKSPKPLWNAVKSSISGIVALIIISLMSKFTEIYLPLSFMNIGISSIVGIPGVCMLVVLNMIFLH